jgi:NTE family protein
MPGEASGRTAFVFASDGSFDRERIGDRVEIGVVPPLCPLDVSPYDFTRAGELIDPAAASTREWIDAGGLAHRESPHQLNHHPHRPKPA